MTLTSKQAAEQPQSLDEIIKEWLEDAEFILKSCDTPIEKNPWKPCEGCQWHAAGLRQAAQELTPYAAREAERRKELEALRDALLHAPGCIATLRLDGNSTGSQPYGINCPKCALTALLELGTAAGASESRK